MITIGLWIFYIIVWLAFSMLFTGLFTYIGILDENLRDNGKTIDRIEQQFRFFITLTISAFFTYVVFHPSLIVSFWKWFLNN